MERRFYSAPPDFAVPCLTQPAGNDCACTTRTASAASASTSAAVTGFDTVWIDQMQSTPFRNSLASGSGMGPRASAGIAPMAGCRP